MPRRLERTARALCLTLNTVFFLLSTCLIAFVCLAAINTPKPDISPQPLNSYPQYIITILLIASYSCCLFCLNAFGFVSLCLQGTFLMSIAFRFPSAILNTVGVIAIIRGGARRQYMSLSEMMPEAVSFRSLETAHDFDDITYESFCEINALHKRSVNSITSPVRSATMLYLLVLPMTSVPDAEVKFAMKEFGEIILEIHYTRKQEDVWMLYGNNWYILGQIAMIAVQVIAVAFTVTVRKRLHYKLEETWRARPVCAQPGECVPVLRFLRSETLLITIFCIFLSLQVLLLIASAIVCEQRSYEERKRLLKEREQEEDDDD